MASVEFLSPYQTGKVLEGVIAALPKVRPNFLQQAMFSGWITRNTLTVNFDKEFAVKNVVAEFVTPRADTTPIQLGNFGTTELYFAYSKESWGDDDFEVLDTRQIGEQFNSIPALMSIQARRLVEKATIAEQRFENLFELCSAHIAMYGAYAAKGEKHPTMLYNFGRNVISTYATLSPEEALVPSCNLTTTAVTAPWDSTVTILPVIPTSGGFTAGDKAWTKALVTAGSATPVADLAKMLQTASRWGGRTTAVIMQDSPYAAFNFDVNTNFADNASNTTATMVSNALDLGSRLKEVDGLTFRRFWTADNGVTIPIYTYNAKYNNRDTGTETQYIGDGWVICVPDTSNFMKIYGRIKHKAAKYMAMPRFIHRWMDDKTASEEFEEHTSFLLASTRINSLVAWKVV
jgi:Phage major capsid protein E.